MLSIGKLTAGAGSARYYEESVAPDRHDYYAGRGESEGVWAGEGARGLGIQGVVRKGQLETLLSGRHPTTGMPLRLTDTTVQGFDLTFSAPKSISVLYAVGNEAIRQAVVGAHARAVRDAVGYLERQAVQVRRGRGGAIKEHAGGLVAGAYQHRTSRAGDPQLHTHVVAANMAQGADGRWTALHGAPLYAHAKTAGYLYQAALRGHLTRELAVGWTPVVSGAAEILGVPLSVLEHFSQRRAEIRQAMAAAGTRSADAARVAALETRRVKQHDREGSTVYERWQARAAEHGLTQADVAKVVGREFSPEVDDEQLRCAAAFMAGERGLTYEASTFSRREALQAWAAEHRAGADVSRLETLADRWLGSELVVRVDGERLPIARGQVIATRRGVRVADIEDRYSTPEMLETERQLLTAAASRRSSGAGVAAGEHTVAALAARPHLADEQAAMVRALTTSGDGVQVVLAKAGAGKTTALDAARDAWQRSGIAVQGTALGSYATKELRDSGIDACTIARLLLDVQRFGLPQGSVLIVDEAGMVGTRKLGVLARYAEAASAKLVLVGDDRQLPEIDAGGAFRGLADRLGAVELHDNRRQRDPADREALDAYREGRHDELVDSLRRRGRVTVAPDVEQTRRGLADDWWRGAEEVGLANVAMIALRRSEVRALNELAREAMHRSGRLGEREVVVSGDRAFAPGDRVVTRQNAPKLGVVNGSRGMIEAVTDDGAMDVRLDDGDRTVHLPAEYVTGERGGQPFVDHGYAITANGIQGGTTARAYVLGSEEAYREWGYVAFSRHRQELRFYVTAPDVVEHEQLELGVPPVDPLATIMKALGETRAKALGLDAAAQGRFRQVPDDRLLSEAAHLRQVLETAPATPVRARLDALAASRIEAAADLDRAAARRSAAEHELAGAPRRHRPMLAKRLEGYDQAVTQWRNRLAAIDAERSAIVSRHGDPDAWIATRESTLQQLAGVETELLRRARVREAEALRMVTIAPPDHVVAELGPRPDDPTARRAWDAGARAIESYRRRRSVRPDQPGLGDRPTDDHARRAYFAASRRLEATKAVVDRGVGAPYDAAIDIAPPAR